MAETEVQEPIRRGGRFFILGPAIALLMFAQAMTGTVLADLILYRTCINALSKNYTKCNILRSNASSKEARDLEAEIEPYATTIIMVKSLIESIIPAVLSLFLGPWSDRGGRRPLLMAGLIGYSLMFAALSVICTWNMSSWYLLVPSFPAFLLGGTCAVMIGAVCHITDITTEKDRTMLLAWLQAGMLVGYVLGLFAGPFIYEQCGYTTVFSTAAICCVVALLYTFFFVPETVQDTSKESLCGLFKVSFVKDLVASSLTKRDGYHRSVVWLVISIIVLFMMVYQGDASIGFYFARERVGWDVEVYSYYSGATVLLGIAGVFCGVSIFSRILGFSDTLVVSIALVSAIVGALVKAFAFEGWHMYLAAVIGIFTGAVGPVLRSIITKSVPSEDIGKIFSLTSSMETISPLAGAPLYTLIYSHYLPPIYPSPVYIFTAGLFLVALLLTISIEVLLRRKSRSVIHVPLVNEE